MSAIGGRTCVSRRRRSSPRHCALIALLALASSFGVAVRGPSAALALNQRGHAFDNVTFGSSGEGALSDPGGLAVSDVGATAGDVYVLDHGNNRIVRFAPESDGAGKLTVYKSVSAWGYGVKDGVKEYETCEVSCRAGIAGTKKYQFNGAVAAIAVDDCVTSAGVPCSKAEDPSVGDVYVLAQAGSEGEEGAVEKFSATGQALERITVVRWREPGEREGEKGELEKEELEFEEAHGLTVGPDGRVWLYYGEDLYGLSDVALNEATLAQRPLELSLTGEPAPGLAVDGGGDVYVGQTGFGASGPAHELMSKWRHVQGKAELEEVAEALDGEESVAVATSSGDVPANGVDERGDVYVADVSRVEGHDLTTVGAFAPDGSALQRFGAPGLSEGAGIAVSAASGTVFVSDAAGNDVDVFPLEDAGAPRVDGMAVQSVSSETVRLSAQIDPAGASTGYVFEYGTHRCTEAPSSCAKAQGDVPGEGFGDQRVTVSLGESAGAPLLPGTTYRYRVLARNAHGESEGHGEGTFRTAPATIGEYGADGRGWELVSPAQKDGANVEPLGGEAGGLIQAAADGGAVTYVANGPFAEPEGSRSIEVAQILSTRGEHGGWSSKDLITPNSSGLGLTIGAEKQQEYEFFAPNLSLALLTPFQSGPPLAEPPLSPPVGTAEAGRQEKTIYLRDNRPLAPEDKAEGELYGEAAANGVQMGNPGYLALVTGADAPGVEFGVRNNLRFAGATADLSHVLIESLVSLRPSSPVGQDLYEWSNGGGGKGSLTEVNLLEDGTPVKEAHLGVGRNGEPGRNLSHAVSADGSRVFWSTQNEHHLYMRDMTVGRTLQLDRAQGVNEPPQGAAVFHTASVDGSRVFFTDSEPLTPESGEAGKPDLYVCEITVNQAGEPSCTLTDLTSRHEGESANVQRGTYHGGVLGASADGSSVYFVADGVLNDTPDARGETAAPGLCGREGFPAWQVACNLYVARRDPQSSSGWRTSFIARLSGEDEPDWQGTGHLEGQGALTSRVSNDGRWLAFMSDQDLTGYDSRATSPTAQDAPAEEVYLYDSTTGGLVCASCEPSGARPVGVFDPPHGTLSELIVDPSAEWGGRWLAGSIPQMPSISGYETQALYQSRYLSDSGRLFFDSPEALVPTDTNGLEDVYEYEPPGVPTGQHQCTSASVTYSQQTEGCIGLVSSGASSSESAFLDASESGGENSGREELGEGGGDVFFLTAQKLLPEDVDGSFDVYDAHECTTQEPCAPHTQQTSPTICESASSCRPYSQPAALGEGPGSSSPATVSNLTPHRSVLAQKTKSRAPTSSRAQRLAKALHVCHTRYRRSQKKRAACEGAARKRYRVTKLEKARKNGKTTSAFKHRGRHPVGGSR
jgi:WD40-like Beta Propeller Repeat